MILNTEHIYHVPRSRLPLNKIYQSLAATRKLVSGLPRRRVWFITKIYFSSPSDLAIGDPESFRALTSAISAKHQ